MRHARSTDTISFALGMPTRGRFDALLQTLNAINKQTMPPERIYLVDNNEDGEVDLSTICLPDNVEVLPRTGSQISADQMVLRMATLEEFEYFVKWDDDLVPSDNCLELLVRAVACNGVAATGGMYHRKAFPKRSFLDNDGQLHSGDGIPGHLQFSLWKGDHMNLRVPALYSSFAYRVGLANMIGGFCEDLKIHKHDTEFTIRLGHLGALIVLTNAEALHLVSSGGVRSGNAKERKNIMRKDDEVFQQKMKDYGLDPFSWRYQCGLGTENE